LQIENDHEFFANGALVHNSTYFSKRCKAAPMHSKRVRYWDRASTHQGSCANAGVLTARDQDGNWYVEHVERGQWEPVERNARILATARRDRAKYGERYQPQIVIEDEGGSTSKDANMMLAKVLAGFSVRFEHPTGAKDIRAEPWSAQLASGNVWLVEDGRWDINAFVEEHCLFRPEPGKRLGGLVDQVDAAAAAFSWLLGSAASSGVMRVLAERGSKQGLRVLVLADEELAQVIVDEPALLVQVVEPGAMTGSKPPVPAHGLDQLAGSLVLEVAPIDPADYQGCWDDPVQPWGLVPEELVLDREDGKRLWGFLTKRREPPPQVWVFAGEPLLALSIAQGVCDTVGLARTAIYCPSQDEAAVLGQPKLPYACDLVKATRSMVM
jgi:predicted phage terminase large subunit-like protein